MYIIEALKKKYEGDIEVAKANVRVYMTTPAGIGEHSNVVQDTSGSLLHLHLDYTSCR